MIRLMIIKQCFFKRYIPNITPTYHVCNCYPSWQNTSVVLFNQSNVFYRTSTKTLQIESAHTIWIDMEGGWMRKRLLPSLSPSANMFLGECVYIYNKTDRSPSGIGQSPQFLCSCTCTVTKLTYYYLVLVLPCHLTSYQIVFFPIPIPVSLWLCDPVHLNEQLPYLVCWVHSNSGRSWAKK